jgi:hypothetical protein
MLTAHGSYGGASVQRSPRNEILYADRFIEAVQDLLNEGRVIALRKDEHNQFSVVQLDRDQLTYELQNADHCNTTSSLAVLIACLKDGSIVA